MRTLYQIHTINLSVAVVVGFLALFGIATDDGVIMSTYITQIMREHEPKTVKEVREAIPSFGGMCVAVITVFVVPVLYSAIQERKLKHSTG